MYSFVVESGFFALARVDVLLVVSSLLSSPALFDTQRRSDNDDDNNDDAVDIATPPHKLMPVLVLLPLVTLAAHERVTLAHKVILRNAMMLFELCFLLLFASTSSLSGSGNAMFADLKVRCCFCAPCNSLSVALRVS